MVQVTYKKVGITYIAYYGGIHVTVYIHTNNKAKFILCPIPDNLLHGCLGTRTPLTITEPLSV